MTQDRIDELLAFWFVQLTPKQWFEKNNEVDEAILHRFMGDYGKTTAQAFVPETALVSAEVALAHLILFDQLPRNMFRGAPRSFESDARALRLAELAIERRFDEAVPKERRIFFYLPFEHSESLADQARSVSLFEKLGNPVYIEFARAHYDVIARFGRFPHRNSILKRQSTPEEEAFLSQPGSSF